jgi:hypothetical protein
MQAVSGPWNGPCRNVDYRQHRLVALVLSPMRKWVADHAARNIRTKATTGKGDAPRNPTEASVARLIF